MTCTGSPRTCKDERRPGGAAAGRHVGEVALEFHVDVGHRAVGLARVGHGHPAAGADAAQVKQPHHRVDRGFVGVKVLGDAVPRLAKGLHAGEHHLREQPLGAAAEAPQRRAGHGPALFGDGVEALRPPGHVQPALRLAGAARHRHEEVGREPHVHARRLAIRGLAEHGHPARVPGPRVPRRPRDGVDVQHGAPRCRSRRRSGPYPPWRRPARSGDPAARAWGCRTARPARRWRSARARRCGDRRRRGGRRRPGRRCAP